MKLPLNSPRSIGDPRVFSFRSGGSGVLAAAAVIFASGTTVAATWTGGRTTPALTELVTIDATGEQGWLYGAEDLAGDGLDSFKQQEQSIDIRTAYATTDSTRLWVRVYVSEQNAVGGNVTIYIFIDADANSSTGGSAIAPEIDPKFTEDSSTGRYEYAIAVRGNGAITGLWTWDAMQMLFVGSSPAPAEAEAEIDQDIDPIQINSDSHGYAQAMVDLGLVDLTPACAANLYIRSSNETAALGTGDLEVGQVGPCVPADDNGDGVPDIIVPSVPCTSDDQCPANGLCVNGECVIPIPCVTDADCRSDEQCTTEGICVVVPGGMCQTNADCIDLVCSANTCSPCTPGGTDCGPDRRCTVSGRCIDDIGGGQVVAGLPLTPVEDVQGGALTCGIGSRGERALTWGLLLVGFGAASVGRAFGRRARKHAPKNGGKRL